MAGTNMVKYNNRIVAENSPYAFEAKVRHLSETYLPLLDFLRENKIQSTFFVTGRIYEACPDMIEAIAAAGHEIGWHGHNHVAMTDEGVLRRELEQSASFLDKYQPKGFRAPWVIAQKSFLPILKKAGFQYDSSCFDSPGRFHHVDGMKILPVTGWRLFGGKDLYSEQGSRYTAALRVLPIGSNFTVSVLRRHYALVLERLTKQRENGIFYLHNWQIFPWPERQLSILKNRLRYVQKFPLLDTVKYLSERQTFFPMERLLEADRQVGHCLTFDIE